MAFDTQTVTIKGAELLAAATAQDKLIIVGCDVTQTYMTQAQAVNISARPANPFSNTTTVTQLGSTANHINSRVYFRAGENTGGDANTLFLYGHKQSDPTNDFVIFIASAETPFHLPVVGDVVDEWETALDIVYSVNADSVGYAEQSTYCTISEFNLLKERTVTTHKEGDVTHGDNQTILGSKIFRGYVQCLDTLDARESIESFGDLNFQCEEEPHGIKFVISELPEVTIMADEANGGTIHIASPNISISDTSEEGAIRMSASRSTNRTDLYIRFPDNEDGHLHVTGATVSLYDDLNVDGTLHVDGPIDTYSTATIEGGATIGLSGDTATSLTVYGSASVSNALSTNTLNTSGLSTFLGNLKLGDSNTDGTISLFTTIDTQTIYSGPNVSGNSTVIGIGNGSYAPKIQLRTYTGGTANAISLSAPIVYLNGQTNAFLGAPIFNVAGYTSNTNTTCNFFGTLNVDALSPLAGGEIVIKDSDHASIITISASSTGGSISITDGTKTTTVDEDGFSSGDGTNSVGFSSNGTGSISGNLYVGGLSGIAPSVSGTTLSVPIGGIVGAIGKVGGYINTCKAGTSFSIAANTVKTALWDSANGVWAEDLWIPEGTYTALTGFSYSSSGSLGVVFLIRTATA